ncbi:AI-2E family transporter [Aetokthonos hydrillicola Thurmond2011]|uniref:AI-2E family transporter n=1 Tax=Aetokthonos hydrillicola Thurmond2011 TaxID=2712845 RepID=A0AAP5IEM1_9CYAN|nr:AI-2E family transporter [Aetokthonos hydrillicola]MBO3463754.1 AI-2E family transporter [Aetokthonos hydrillicola CCALA 1050]MBW4587017.1 AI-2E family transporter [Aetokthonos hydrillicola CCALA 1050]MDR9897510.1 AI-2E family transporter [Aetokthonos hydrillicola Thurmond2011]
MEKPHWYLKVLGVSPDFQKPWNIQLPSLIQQSFQNYFAGQATLAMIESTALIALFLVFQIPFGLLFGLVIGMASFIPFGGTVIVSLILPILAIQNIWLAVKLLVIAVLVGQINETIVVPRLMGQITGVNPAVIFISLLCGAKLGGVLGILLAIPLTSFLKRFADSFLTTRELRVATP